MRFKVLSGKHAQKDKDGKVVVYRQGDIVETNSDLVAKFNSPNAVKFERVEDGPTVQQRPASAAQPTPAQPSLAPRDVKEFHAAIDKMNLAELKQLAEDDEVDLKGETDIHKIRKVLKAI